MKTKLDKSNVKLQHAMLHGLEMGLVSVLLVLAGTGYKNEADSNADSDPTGVCALVSVDGKNVPCDLAHGGATLTIKSGVFTINADSTCRSQMAFTMPSRGDRSTDMKAAYTRHGAELSMQWEGAGMTMGNVKSNTFTTTNEDMVLAYRK